ncbi:MAG: DUF58 domain-containing protein [Phycisphaerales bacterium]
MLREDLMAKVRQLQVYTARMVDDLFAGEFSSAFKGQGMEFDEVREYAPGDDIRSIDWNVTARTGTPHIKRFVEERELTIVLATDLSASGHFGSIDRSRNELAAEIASVLAIAAVKSNDKVGLLTFTDRIESFVPPAKGRRHAWRVVRDILDAEPTSHATDAHAALEHLARVLRRRAVIFLLSDFLFPGVGLEPPHPPASPFLNTLTRLATRHDLIALALTDPRELELPHRSAGLIPLIDAETGRTTLLDTASPRIRRNYEQHAARHRAALARQFRAAGADLVHIRTDQPYVHALIELFRARERRNHR